MAAMISATAKWAMDTAVLNDSNYYDTGLKKHDQIQAP